MKKFISILLAVMLVASVVVTASAYSVWPNPEPDSAVQEKTSDEAIAEYVAEFGETPETYRYYFIMPDGTHGMRSADGTTVAGSWYNDYSKGAGVYWWGSAPAACESWAGYQALVADEAQHIYYSNVPTAVTTIIFNNGVDGGEDPDAAIYKKAAQTINIPSEYPDPEEYDTMPEGADSFDNCVWIIDPDSISINELSGVPTCGGTWYFYYKDGCYGEYAEDSANFKSVEENCCNPDHYKDGVHVGYQPGEDPTEPETTAIETEPETKAPETEPETTAPTYVRGDYDGDGEVLIIDATKAQRFIAELDPMPEEAFLKGVDATGDGDFTILDATRIQRVLAELCDWDGNALS